MGICGKYLAEFQEILGVSDELVASRAKYSSATYRRAKKDLVPKETKESFLDVLEGLRPERLAEIANYRPKSAG